MYEYLAIFVKIDGYRIILTKLGQHVNEMMAVAMKNFKNFLWSRFLIIRQNANMATNAILYCGLHPTACKSVPTYIIQGVTYRSVPVYLPT